MSVRRGEGEVAYRFHGELSVKRNVQMWRQLCGSREMVVRGQVGVAVGGTMF